MHHSQTVVGVATMHGKETQIIQGFKDVLDWEIVAVDIDTDMFGTFTGDIPRPLSPKETARAKCLAGIQISGLSRMIASEGTFGPHPMMPFLTLNTELLFFFDRENDLEVFQTYSSTEVIAFKEAINTDTDFDRLVTAADLPNHALILRDDSEQPRVYAKGVTNLDQLRESIPAKVEKPLIVETDFRAMVNPTRQKNIAECARLLAQKLATKCQSCESIGWGIVDYERGLPCSDCGARANREVSAEVFGCPRCDHTEKRLVEALASPSNCDFCNP